MLKSAIVNVVQRTLLSQGFTLAKANTSAPLELLSESTDPRTLWFCSPPRPIIIFAEVESLRSASTGHMWNGAKVHAIAEAIHQNNITTGLKELIRIQRLLVPQTSAALSLGLTEDEAPGLLQEPRWNKVLPWDLDDPPKHRDKMLTAMASEHRVSKSEVRQLNDKAEEWSRSDRFIDVEMSRLVAIIESVRWYG